MAEGFQFNPNDGTTFRFARRLATETRRNGFDFLAGLPDLATQKGGSLAIDPGRTSVNVIARDESRLLIDDLDGVPRNFLYQYMQFRDDTPSGRNLKSFRSGVKLGELATYEREGIGYVGITVEDGELFQQDRAQLVEWMGERFAAEVALEPCEEFVLDVAAYFPGNVNGLDDVLTMVDECAPTWVDLFDVQLYQ
jgi:hypothetical protein